MIHNEVSVGDNCAIAAGTVLYSGCFEEHLMIGGNPGKILARNIDFDRRPDLSYEEFDEYKKSGVELIERDTFFDAYLDADIYNLNS